MHKVVTERPRAGHANPSRKWGGRVGEDYDGATFVSSARRRQYGWNARSFSDFLAPLRRYLHAQVGRPWDKVYSEVRKALPNGLHSDHLWTHIRQEVALHCFERDGTVYARRGYFFGEVEVSGLYVHPRTKLLCFRQWKPVVAPSRPVVLNRITLGDNEEYRRIEGIWYYLQFVRVDAIDPPALRLIRKKQLNRKELRQLRIDYPDTE